MQKYKKGQECPICKSEGIVLNMPLSILTGMCMSCRSSINVPDHIPREQSANYLIKLREKEENE